MTFDRTSSQPLQFDPSKLGTVKPRLAEPEGFALSHDQLHRVFGIDPQSFGKLPKRLVVPVLHGSHYTEGWHQVTGYLYIVEPQAWVPKVSHGETMPASAFKTTYVREQETITETKFNAGTSAELSLEAGGTYYGVTASVKSTSEISFKYSSSTTTKETLETRGVSGNVPIHQLFVYPVLRCKVIKKQRIEYTINDKSEELKWSPDSYSDGYWSSRCVGDQRLAEFKNLALHPVPMEGDGLAGKGYILPLPQLTSSNDLEVTTIMSRQGWTDWYVYDAPWQTADQTIDIAAPRNDVAFRPMTTWTTLPPS